jgi:hypothetical protein
VLQHSRVQVREKLGRAMIQKILAKQQNAAYVLITCAAPKEDGRMEVELIYEGDEDLAAYLIETAHGVIGVDE